MLEPFLDFFRGQAILSPEFFELCYLSAYDALPTALERDPEGFWRTYFLAKQPGFAWYTQMCLLTQKEVDYFFASTFLWHKGRLPNGREYMVLEYPEPDPVELTVDEFGQGLRLDSSEQQLGPYFSAVLRTTTTGPASCFALGQSPVDEITTLRRCTSAAHYNLGQGPDPKLGDFLVALMGAEEMPAKAVTIRHKDYLSDLDRKLIASTKL